MVDAMMFMLPSVNDEIHRLLKEKRLADALDVSATDAIGDGCHSAVSLLLAYTRGHMLSLGIAANEGRRSR